MIVFLPLLICLIGLVIYSISANPKAQSLALDMFWVGLLAFLLLYPSAHLVIR